jgi:hypothetical protein
LTSVNFPENGTGQEPEVVANSSKTGPMTLLENHPEKNIIRAQLRQNVLLKDLSESDRAELEAHLVIVDGNKGDFLLHQGVREMEQYFILDGILKRVVSNPEGKEMILRFADEHDMETSYAALRLGTPTPYGIVCVTKARVASLPLKEWITFLEPAPRDQGAVRVPGDEGDERDHGAHDHAAPARMRRGACTGSCASTPSWKTGFRARSWLRISISPQKPLVGFASAGRSRRGLGR